MPVYCPIYFTFAITIKDTSYSFIINVQEDATGMLWIKLRTDIYSCYDPQKEIFIDAKTVLEDKYGITDMISTIYVDEKKDLWFHS